MTVDGGVGCTTTSPRGRRSWPSARRSHLAGCSTSGAGPAISFDAWAGSTPTPRSWRGSMRLRDTIREVPRVPRSPSCVGVGQIDGRTTRCPISVSSRWSCRRHRCPTADRSFATRSVTATSFDHWLRWRDLHLRVGPVPRLHRLPQAPASGCGHHADPRRERLLTGGSDGGVFTAEGRHSSFRYRVSGLHPAGSGLPNSLNKPIVGIVSSANGQGSYMVASDGGVLSISNWPVTDYGRQPSRQGPHQESGRPSPRRDRVQRRRLARCLRHHHQGGDGDGDGDGGSRGLRATPGRLLGQVP